MGPNISEIVINVLKNESKPIGVDEITFRARSTKTAINEILGRLKKARIVKQTDGNRYQLNAQNDFDIQSMI